MASLPPSFEVRAEFLFSEPKTREFGLHETAGLQETLTLVLFSFLGEGYIKANGSAVARHLNGRHRLEVRGELGPEFTNANTDGHGSNPVDVYTP
jgi:hypothetical protein